MIPADYDEFAALLVATYDLMGKTPAAKLISAGSLGLFFGALREYSLADIRMGLEQHVRTGTFTPVPNDIRAAIEARRPVQWISADEAWARIPKAAQAGMLENGRPDYRAAEPPPCLLNQVTALALAVAAPFLAEGDDNAARMAFRACYDRLAAQAKLHGSKPEYFLSPGGSHEEQQDVLAEGARLGLIAAAPKREQLGAPNPAQQRDIQRMMAGLERVSNGKKEIAS